MLILCVSEYKDTYISKTGENSDCATRRIPVKMSTVDSVDFTGETHRCGGCDIPSDPPVMKLRSKDFFKILFAPLHHLHPNSRILSEGQIQIFKRVSRQNPPVLLPPEMVCSARKHPLSSVSGRRRYNRLDFIP